jgi:hypothetical protein
MTDGRTLYWDEQMDFDWYAANDPGPVRGLDRFGIPADDEARTRVYLVYRAMNEIMCHAGDILASVPSSLDDYVALLGRRNPVTWTNPYTNEPMHEVPWAEVPCYYGANPADDPLPDINAPPQDEAASSEPAGNFSYALGLSPVVEGENRGYAQFYFYLPDGSLAAYLAVGKGPQEYAQGSQGWADMAMAAGWNPGE